MRNQIIALSVGLMSMGVFAQKQELKDASKAIKKLNFSDAVAAINSAEALIGNMDAKNKAKFYFLKAQAFAGNKDYEAAANSFDQLFAYEKEIGKLKYTPKAKPMVVQLSQDVSTKAIELYNKDKDYKKASEFFKLTYVLSPKDTTFMFNAALSAVQAEDYDTAIEYYKELKNIGYTGITTQYLATDVKTGEEVDLGSKAQRDIYIKTGTVKDPKDVVTESKKAEIVKQIGYILIRQGKTEEAMAAIKEARKADPKDVNLLLNEADLYIKLKKMDKFSELMEEAVKLDPTNHILFFNLGVVNANQNKQEEAIKYYKKAIELKPDYGDAYMNLASSILSGERAIVDEMNKNLSNFKKYDQLEKQQRDLYKKALPFLEKADSLSRNIDTVKALLNIYDTLAMDAKSKEYRAMYKAMK